MAKQIVHKNPQKTPNRDDVNKEKKIEKSLVVTADRWTRVLTRPVSQNGMSVACPSGVIHPEKRTRARSKFPYIFISFVCFGAQVLDVGFNLMNVLPDDAFSPTALLTLLALDGNPLATLPRQAFAHLNGTLRGLSLGGRFLECDCRLRWVAEWIRDTDLQVTSRERSPQFCGSPTEYRTRSFYQLGPDGIFVCFFLN